MENSNNATQLIGTLLVGVAIGGVLGVIFAPNKGSVTRKKITDESDELTDAIKDKFNNFMDGIKNDFEIVKHKAHKIMGDGLGKGERIK